MVDTWPIRRGPFLHRLTQCVGYDVHERTILYDVNDCEHLYVFLSSDVWAQFSQTQAYVQVKTRHPARNVDLHK